MFFALGMERVEARLRQVAVGENDVEEFLEQARPNEVRELFRHGIGRALELFRGRRRTPSGRHGPVAISAGAEFGADGWADADGDDAAVTTIPMAIVLDDGVQAARSRAS